MKLPFLLVFLYLTSALPAQQTPHSYFQNNCILLDSVGHLTSTDVFGSQYQVFLTGEAHALTADAAVSNSMIRYLYAKHGLRTVVMELPVSNQPFINAWVLRGNKDSLNMLKGFGGFNKVFKREMEFLYTFNKTKKNSDKIRVVTIDVEIGYKDPLRLLGKLLPGETPPSEISTSIDLLRSMVQSNGEGEKDLLEKKFRSIAIDLKAKPVIYKNYLGTSFPLFEKLVIGTDLGSNYDVEAFYRVITPETRIKDSIFVNKREEFLYLNFLEVLAAYPGQILFGQFGKAHVSLRTNEQEKYTSMWNCMAARLNSFSNSPVKDKVCAIDIVYPGRPFFSGTEYDDAFHLALQDLSSKIKDRTTFLISTHDPACPWKILNEKFRFVAAYLD